MKPFMRIFFGLLLLALAACGQSAPQTPPPPPPPPYNAAGTWTGIASAVGISYTVRMIIADNTGAITGSITLTDPANIPTDGNVQGSRSSSNSFNGNLTLNNGVIGTLNGNFNGNNFVGIFSAPGFANSSMTLNR